MSRKVFVGGLAWSTTQQSLEQAFGRFGEIEEAVVVTERDTGRSRGFGFVTFKEEEAATEAIRSMNGAELDGRPIRVDNANDRPARGGGGDRGGFGAREGGGNRDRSW